jgi:nucleotide-binding universal stress UspA family protein
MTHTSTALFSEYEHQDDTDMGAILVAIKPDDGGNAAVGAAQWLAEHERRALHIVSVIETAPLISPFAAGTPALPPFHDESERREVKRRLREFFERSGHRASTYRFDVMEGSAAETVTDIAREHDAAVVVIGTGTDGRISHLIYGEQTIEIVRMSRSPVLIVPPAASYPFERAMVAVDFSGASLRAALTAQEMLGAGGSLTLVHVKRPQGTAEKGAGRWNEAFGRRMREKLVQFARLLPEKPGLAIELDILHGAPADVLTAYVHTHAMQLLACGWHDHALMERIFVRSNASELIHRTECAVLVAPEPRSGANNDDAA